MDQIQQLSADAKVQIENKIQSIVADLLTADSIERAFCGLLVHSPEASKQSRDSKLHQVIKFFQSVPNAQEGQEFALKCFVTRIFTQSYTKSGSLLLFDILESLVEKNVVPAKVICDALLTCDKLTYDNSDKWTQTLALVRRIVGGVDYKGCRDLLRLILERSQSVAAIDNVNSVIIIESMCDVVRYILDRNACLLPGYFAVNEIIKIFSDDRPYPHWKIGQLLGDFVQSFRPAAQMVSICGRSQLLPVVGHSSTSSNVWRLHPVTLRFLLSGPLPFDKGLYDPQTTLLRYVVEQPYSREMVCSMLNLVKASKQRCAALEDQLVDLVILAMERSEDDDSLCDDLDNGDGVDRTGCIQLWQHLSSQLIFFVLFQFASFPHMVIGLYKKLKVRDLRKGRDYLMWILLQFISGSIQKNPLEDFLPTMKLYDLLYPETEPLPLADINKASCTFKMAVTSIWIHVNKKAQNDKVQLQRPIPQALSGHIEFLKQCLSNKTLTMSDYKIVLLCNAYSTNSENFALPMGVLVEAIYGNAQKTTLLPGNVVATAPTQPLAMNMLDSLTVHAKMSLIHSIVTRVIRMAQNKTPHALAPALVETYSRLLVYIEIESLGIKGFISQLLPSVFKSNAWGILHTLLEMFSYRLHHIQPHYRVQLLGQLHHLSQVPQMNQYQLYLCVESTALHLIMGLGSWEVQPQLSRVVTEPKFGGLVSSDSEELNRAMVLTLARAVHVTGSESTTGNWCKEILTGIVAATPFSWPSYTLACFPATLSDFFQQQVAPPREDKQTLKRNVEMEYRRWKSMATENDLITHFSTPGTLPLFICVLWKTLQEDNRIAPTAYKVLERLGPRALAAHLRIFADYLICEFSMPATSNQHVNRLLESLNDLIWKCCVVPIDRLVLCLALRNVEGNEASVCCFIMHCLLHRCAEFRSRVQDFVKENSPDHWLQYNWHDRHMAFHRKYPEKYYFEVVPEMAAQPQHQYLPVYFGNVCLRFLPVFDIVIHRFIELPPIGKQIELLLEMLGGLYKFHDRPLTYLYNTLHYYDKRLQERPVLKRKLVQAIVGSFKEIKPSNWCLSEDYLQYLDQSNDDWSPDADYYMRLMARLVDTLAGLPTFPSCDWRFNEFPNAAAHAMYVTCIELMALPVSGPEVGNALYNLVLKGILKIPRDKVFAWLNAVGLIVTALPECYWIVLHEHVIQVIRDPQLADISSKCNPFQMFNFGVGHHVMGELQCGYVLALCHAVWVHASIGQLSALTQFVKELKPIVKREEQFLFVCHLVGPFFQRFHIERTRCMLDLTVELYEMLEAVDKSVEHMRFIDPISDFLYHVKYMFVGDGVKTEVEKVIRTLRPALQLRLRFIAHHGREEGGPINQPSVTS